MNIIRRTFFVVLPSGWSTSSIVPDRWSCFDAWARCGSRTESQVGLVSFEMSNASAPLGVFHTNARPNGIGPPPTSTSMCGPACAASGHASAPMMSARTSLMRPSSPDRGARVAEAGVEIDVLAGVDDDRAVSA